MLKMTIDNEEVVSDKDITINEEMLSASSTILNNVYPKEWEEDKDYTSRFYYPQDYSKALIQRSYVTQEAEAGTTIQVNGSVTLTDVDTTKNSRVLRLLGQTSQTGTPTPSSPIPVNVVSGDNEIAVCGKNICFTDFGDWESGEYNSIGNKGNNTSRVRTKDLLIVKQSTTYFLDTSSSNDSFIVREYDKNKTFIKNDGIIANGGTITTMSSCYFLGITLFSNTNQTRSYDTYQTLFEENSIKPFICLNSVSNKTYEPYQGNTYNIDLPVENLFDKSATPISNASTTMSELDTGVRATVTSAGNNRYSAYKLSNSDSLLGKTLNISATITTSGTNNGYIRFYWLNGNTLTSVIAQTINSTGNANVNIPSSYPSGSNGIAILFSSNASGTSSVGDYVDYTNVMLTYDKYKGKYTPYGTTPIELCSSQDGTKRDGFIHDKTLDKWYWHREIGKVVFTGADSETWNIDNAVQRTVYTGISTLIKSPTNNDTQLSAFTNLLQTKSFNEVYSSKLQGISCSTGGNLSLHINGVTDTGSLTLESWKTWLGSNNISLYYILATPTNTEITYTPLIEQLNAIKLATSKQGQTDISQENNDKPFIIDAEAIKDLSSVLDRIELLES